MRQCNGNDSIYQRTRANFPHKRHLIVLCSISISPAFQSIDSVTQKKAAGGGNLRRLSRKGGWSGKVCSEGITDQITQGRSGCRSRPYPCWDYRDVRDTVQDGFIPTRILRRADVFYTNRPVIPVKLETFSRKQLKLFSPQRNYIRIMGNLECKSAQCQQPMILAPSTIVITINAATFQSTPNMVYPGLLIFTWLRLRRAETIKPTAKPVTNPPAAINPYFRQRRAQAEPEFPEFRVSLVTFPPCAHCLIDHESRSNDIASVTVIRVVDPPANPIPYCNVRADVEDRR